MRPGRSLLLVLALLAPLAACKEDSQAAAAPPVRPVLSVKAVVRTTEILGPFAGSIQPRFSTDVGFRIFGRMVARFVDVGAIVKKGDEIAALDPAVQLLLVRNAEAVLANAEAQYVNAEAEEKRQRPLVERNITPRRSSISSSRTATPLPPPSPAPRPRFARRRTCCPSPGSTPISTAS